MLADFKLAFSRNSASEKSPILMTGAGEEGIFMVLWSTENYAQARSLSRHGCCHWSHRKDPVQSWWSCMSELLVMTLNVVDLRLHIGILLST